MIEIEKLERIARLVRYYILRMTTKAGSGHPTSSLSATDLMVALFFDKLKFDLKNPENPANDRIIFSKGHASPLLYALYAVARPQCMNNSDGGQAGVLSEKELDSYRKFGSVLEGHPVPRFKYVEAATGSLGQGLSIGLGMALVLRQECQMSNVKCQMWPKVYVLLGDSEMAEGSVWEALELASYHGVGNLIGIIDVNRLGQSGETMLGWDVERYRERVEAFGWQAHVVDGHNFEDIVRTFDLITVGNGKPKMIIAKTIKGKGVSFLEDKEGWHGKALGEEDFEKAVKELGEIDKSVRGEIAKPISNFKFQISNFKKSQKLKVNYKIGELIATRKAYGAALVKLGEINPEIVSLDAEVKNSTFAEIFKEKFPERFFEMFIAEQNMVGVALGFSKRGYVPFISTFSAFFTRAFDQIRMSAYSRANIKFVGSHAGVSIGEDGLSQMGLEDLAMFGEVFGSTVFCPADAVSCARLVEIAANTKGIFYIRTNRGVTPVIYVTTEKFKIGGSKVVRSSSNDKVTVVACGMVLTEALKAADDLAKSKINIRVVDAYSVKPIDAKTIAESAKKTNNLVVTCEDHYFEGGLGDAVLNVFATDSNVKVYKMAVCKMPMSGKPEELLEYEDISARAIVSKVKEILK